jgi:hypothetical protein
MEMRRDRENSYFVFIDYEDECFWRFTKAADQKKRVLKWLLIKQRQC